MPQTAVPVVEWVLTDTGLTPVLHEGKRTKAVTWAPQPGSQVAFLQCPVFECCYVGTRGPGKSDDLIMDFLRDVGKGWGPAWRGVLFRRTFPELGDIIDKTRRWFPLIFPGAKYNQSEHTWTFPEGEQLLLRHFIRQADYWSYHGHAYPWQGWEELGTWPDDKCYRAMFSCARTTTVGMPIRIRSTANPYGVGHNWIKKRFRLKGVPRKTRGPVIRDAYDKDGNLQPERCYVHGVLEENQILLTADPNYKQRLRAAARNPAELEAWLEGNWDIVAGGMLDDVWESHIHVVPNVPLHLIPKGWYIDRSLDWGSSAPFSVGWWAESNGEPFEYNGILYGKVRGDLYRIAEWYGWTGEDNEGLRMKAGDVAIGIVDRQEDWGIGHRVRVGPADTNIFDDDVSIASDMGAKGVSWVPADKGPGSRKQGWLQLRGRLQSSIPPAGGYREEPGIFIFERCEQFERTVPVLPRSDLDPDDVSDKAEDHIADDTRYRLRHVRKTVEMGRFK